MNKKLQKQLETQKDLFRICILEAFDVFGYKFPKPDCGTLSRTAYCADWDNMSLKRRVRHVLYDHAWIGEESFHHCIYPTALELYRMVHWRNSSAELAVFDDSDTTSEKER